jgi:hypothetical protein
MHDLLPHEPLGWIVLLGIVLCVGLLLWRGVLLLSPRGEPIDGTQVLRVDRRIMGVCYENRGPTYVRCWYTFPRYLGFTLPPGYYLGHLGKYGYEDFHCAEAGPESVSMEYPIPVQFGKPH